MCERVCARSLTCARTLSHTHILSLTHVRAHTLSHTHIYGLSLSQCVVCKKVGRSGAKLTALPLSDSQQFQIIKFHKVLALALPLSPLPSPSPSLSLSRSRCLSRSLPLAYVRAHTLTDTHLPFLSLSRSASSARRSGALVPSLPYRFLALSNNIISIIEQFETILTNLINCHMFSGPTVVQAFQ